MFCFHNTCILIVTISEQKVNTKPDGEGDEQEDAGHAPDTEMFAQEHRYLIHIDERPYTQPGENDHQYAVYQRPTAVAQEDEPRSQ